MKAISTVNISIMVAPAVYKAISHVTMDQEVFGDCGYSIDARTGGINVPAFEVFGGHRDHEITYFIKIFVDSLIDNHGS